MPRQIFFFGVVGLAATAIHYAVALVLSGHITPYIANFVGFIVALGISYIGHLRLTFQLDWEQANHWHRLPRYTGVAVGGFVLSQLVLGVAFDLLQLPVWLALGVAVIVVPVLSFLLSSLWVFRQEKKI